MKIVTDLFGIVCTKFVSLHKETKPKTKIMATSRIDQVRNEMREIKEMFNMGLITPRQKWEMSNEVYQASKQYNRLSK